MIQRIGVVRQGPNDIGFLRGLRDRMGCNAELVELRVRSKNRRTIRSEFRKAWVQAKQLGVDLVVRLTDSDGPNWQDIQREELDGSPEESRSLLVIGVAAPNVEGWLAADWNYCSTKLNLGHTPAAEDLTGAIKKGISRSRAPDQDFSNFVAHFVADVPTQGFEHWLENPSFRKFYGDLRAFVMRHHQDCRIRDEVRNR